MSKIKKLFLGVIIFILLAAGGVYIYMRQSLAPLDGKLALTSISAPIKVLRDPYGIPHIYAKTKLDAMRALGYVMASERLFQMEMARRMTHGELAEVVGEKALKSDKLYRSLMLKKSSERMLNLKKAKGLINTKMWAEMEAFCDGINQYIQTRPLPYELKLLGITPRPFIPMDAYVMTGQMAYSFGIALKADTLMTELAQKLKPNLFRDLRNDNPAAPILISNLEMLKPLWGVAENVYGPSFDSSNSWLIGPRRSASGKSIFANDPHIGFTHPSVWFEVHIETPDFELYGHYLPLVPFAVLGHSRHHAWGFTMSQSDDMDLYRENIDRENHTLVFKNERRKYESWPETIRVKKSADVTFEMIETPHGPLLDNVLDESDVSLKWAYHRVENDPLLALYKMGEAKDMKEFETALQEATAPGLNVMYADPQNIAWWMLGDIAVKKNPNSDIILNGSTGQAEYLRLLSWQEKPHEVNPPSGIIVTANSRPTKMPAEIRGDWQSADRFETITKLLNEKDLWNAAETRELQTQNFSSQTRPLLEKMIDHLQFNPSELIKYASLIESLKHWNQHSEIQSKEASLYYQWVNENILIMLESLGDRERQAYLNTPYAWIFYERTMMDDSSPWWTRKSQSTVVTDGFRRAISKWEHLPQWGDIHTIEYVHPLGRDSSLGLIFNLGPYPMAGAYNEITNNKQRGLGSDFKVVAGASTRRVIDFSEPQRSWGINPIGISGHLLSPYYSNQVQLFLNGGYRPQLMDIKDIEQSKTHELDLE